MTGWPVPSIAIVAVDAGAASLATVTGLDQTPALVRCWYMTSLPEVVMDR